MSARRAAAAGSEPAVAVDPTPAPSRPRRPRRATATANFGSGRREAHDASAFYDRFVAPEISTDSTVNEPGPVDVVHCHDARDMAEVPSDSVALVVTSPPTPSSSS